MERFAPGAALGLTRVRAGLGGADLVAPVAAVAHAVLDADGGEPPGFTADVGAEKSLRGRRERRKRGAAWHGERLTHGAAHAGTGARSGLIRAVRTVAVVVIHVRGRDRDERAREAREGLPFHIVSGIVRRHAPRSFCGLRGAPSQHKDQHWPHRPHCGAAASP